MTTDSTSLVAATARFPPTFNCYGQWKWKQLYFLGPKSFGYSSDGKEVVAVLARSTSWSMTKTYKFAFLGTGLTGTLSEDWETAACGKRSVSWSNCGCRQLKWTGYLCEAYVLIILLNLKTVIGNGPNWLEFNTSARNWSLH
ncbi:uncharacterized protein LY79DRAFT_508261 [Colletotrichum navitas]|uniref:Uncharacterized protein n=1 Tax=Colletotrichum navitas TaxID=681940 RepID=A0AAD8Q9P8_9PEZI|nr:uncharacterized protein LY79DRAFT_508261 [Colletotrichum navitas]KAK1597119.1 hypothetical protein LY79DRAFT_508261 [Colletotrichum navitas]